MRGTPFNPNTEELHECLTHDGLVAVLENLQFRKADAGWSTAISLDVPTRDYLVTALRHLRP